MQLQKALEKQKLKELDLIKTNIEVLKLQLQAERTLEFVFPKEIKQEISKKKWYVVFNGPFPRIYDDWYKAAQHSTKISGVWHESYSTQEEAEKKFREFQERERLKKGKEVYLGPPKNFFRNPKASTRAKEFNENSRKNSLFLGWLSNYY